MVRVTLISDKNKSIEKIETEGPIKEEKQQDSSAHKPDPTVIHNSPSTSNLFVEMSVDQFVEVTNILQCFFELTEKNECHFSNVTSNQKGGDATFQRGEIWPRFMKPKRAVICGRQTLLAWVNKELSEIYTDISQLNNGVAFCRLMDNIAPGIIPSNKIKFYVGVSRWIDNFKLLQQAFLTLRIDRALPGRGKVPSQKELLVFTSWLKAFFEVNWQLKSKSETESKMVKEEGVGDGSSCRDSGCGSGTGSDDSEERLLNNSEERLANNTQTAVSRERAAQESDLPKSDHLHSIDPIQRDVTQCYAKSPIKTDLPNDNARTKTPSDGARTTILNETFSQNTNPVINLSLPKRFTTCGRKTLLTWISSELSRDIDDLVQLSDGVAYCLLINSLNPEMIPLKRITFNSDPFTHHDNYRLLQALFRRYRVKKTIPVRKLIEKNTKEILLFTNWFKAFYELNMASISTNSLLGSS